MEASKAVVSVTEMARTVGLSRSRFYQLVGSAFPFPVYDRSTRRPFYTAELQQVCLDVRRRNCGIDGRPMLFYSLRGTISSKRPKSPEKKLERHADLLDGLRSLGLVAVSATQIEEALGAIYPQGMGGVNQEEVLRKVFLHLKRQDRGDKAGR